MAATTSRSVEDQIRQVKLRTSDQVTICVKIDVVRCSLTILSKYSSLDLEANELLIDLPEINSCILEKVIEWSTFHKNKKTNVDNLDKESLTNELKIFDENFLQVDPGTLFEIVLAADYLDIKALLDLSCNKVVSMIKGKSVEEIRESFGIRNDFTKDEEELVRKENAWCENK